MTESPCLRSPFDTALLTTTIVFVFTATVAVALRLFACHKTATGIWGKGENWAVLAALTFCYGFLIQTICGCAIVGLTCVHSGLDSTWAADETDKIFWTDFFLVIPASALAKISILELYKRLFDARSLYWTSNVLIVLCSFWTVGVVIANFFITSPLRDTWHLSEFKAHENFDRSIFELAVFGIDIGLDLLVLCVPIPQMAELQLQAGQGIKVASVFVLGSFCLVASILRFYYADVQLTHAFSDVAQAAVATRNTAMWSRIEPVVLIITACLPTYTPLFNRTSASLLTTIQNTTAKLSASTFRSSGSKSVKNPSHQSDSSGLSPHTSQQVNPERHAAKSGRHAPQFVDAEHLPQYRASVHSEDCPDSQNIPTDQINVTSEYYVWKETTNDSEAENSPWKD